MRVAIYGCGQLAGMLAMEGAGLGHEFIFIADPSEDTACVEGRGQIFRRTSPQLDEELRAAIASADVITVEREQIDLDVLEQCAALTQMRPPLKAVATTQDRWLEKSLMVELNIPVAPFFDLADTAAQTSTSDTGYIVKSCRSGYDGKHQYRVATIQDIFKLELGEIVRGDWIAEQMIPFDFEFSVLGARGTDGTIVLYPPTENVHNNGILRRSVAPSPRVTKALAETAGQYLKTTLDAMNHVGMLAMECFAIGDQCLVNELAPRVHNSGHWSLFDSGASQFENHIRAVTGMALVEPTFSGFRGMVNLIGEDRSEDSFAPDPDLQVLRYAKTARAGRKLGHVNVRKPTSEELRAAMDVIEQDIYGTD